MLSWKTSCLKALLNEMLSPLTKPYILMMIYQRGFWTIQKRATCTHGMMLSSKVCNSSYFTFFSNSVRLQVLAGSYAAVFPFEWSCWRVVTAGRLARCLARPLPPQLAGLLHHHHTGLPPHLLLQAYELLGDRLGLINVILCLQRRKPLCWPTLCDSFWLLPVFCHSYRCWDLLSCHKSLCVWRRGQTRSFGRCSSFTKKRRGFRFIGQTGHEIALLCCGTSGADSPRINSPCRDRTNHL